MRVQGRDVAAVLAGVLVLSSTVFAEEAVEYRLPPGIYPLSQSIELRLDPNVADYTGSTTITHGGITLGYNNALPTTTATPKKR